MISFIYFDVGGVVVKDFSQTNKWQDLQHELGITKSTQTQYDALWQKYESEICLNRNVDDLIPILKKQLGLPLPPEYSLLQGFVSHFEKNPSLWPILSKIHQHCPVGLLTNMYPGMFQAIEARHLFPRVTWDVVIDSSVVKLQKPDPQIFKLAEKLCQVKPENILFVENGQIHLDAAQKLGWQTFFYDSSDYPKASQQLADYLQTHHCFG
jgi:FMN phosphatase YigB (HAD superfamily)